MWRQVGHLRIIRNKAGWSHSAAVRFNFLWFLLPAETPAPFAVNETTAELVVTAMLDREENESYRLLLVCTVRTETVITKVETSLDVFVDDEDDNAPYLNGTDTADIVISFNRTVVRRFMRRAAVMTSLGFHFKRPYFPFRVALLALCPCSTGIWPQS